MHPTPSRITLIFLFVIFVFPGKIQLLIYLVCIKLILSLSQSGWVIASFHVCSFIAFLHFPPTHLFLHFHATPAVICFHTLYLHTLYPNWQNKLAQLIPNSLMLYPHIYKEWSFYYHLLTGLLYSAISLLIFPTGSPNLFFFSHNSKDPWATAIGNVWFHFLLLLNNKHEAKSKISSHLSHSTL